MSARSFDIAVIGAGLAGLTAARTVAAAGRDVLVLEARDRVGGRTASHLLPGGAPVEVGGQFVGPTQNHILALAAELGIATYPAYNTGRSVYVKRGRARRFGGDIPPDLPALPGLAVAMRRINRLARQVPLGAPWQAPRARAWDAMTFEAWLRRTALGRGALDLVNAFLGSAFGTTAAQASLLFSLWYIAGMGDEAHPGTIERGIGVTGGAQEQRVHGGAHTIARALAEGLGERVVLGAPVREIRQSAGGVEVMADGAIYRARHAIVATPPALAASIAWEPALPAQQQALFRQLSFGHLMKCEAIYAEPFWRTDGLSGQGVFRSRSPLCSMFDNSPPDGRPGILMGFVGGRQWATWSCRPQRERRAAVLRSFAKIAGPTALQPVDYLEHDWTAEAWTGGGPTAVAGPGLLTTLGPWRDRPHGRVRFAGAEHANHWNGYMDGAVRSGNDAAVALLEDGER